MKRSHLWVTAPAPLSAVRRSSEKLEWRWWRAEPSSRRIQQPSSSSERQSHEEQQSPLMSVGGQITWHEVVTILSRDREYSNLKTFNAVFRPDTPINWPFLDFLHHLITLLSVSKSDSHGNIHFRLILQTCNHNFLLLHFNFFIIIIHYLLCMFILLIIIKNGILKSYREVYLQQQQKMVTNRNTTIHLHHCDSTQRVLQNIPW